ncbi:DEK, C-terminal [Sesbania bispinosa]|nr:DEK, C-terminal [Sesbania bispinosa]
MKKTSKTSSTKKESAAKEKVTKGKGKKKEKSSPSDDQLRDAICEILKEVDFNTATFTDILKLLAKQFDMDLNPRKASIKVMIQEELTKLADEADEEEGEEDADKDEAPSTGQEVEA